MPTCACGRPLWDGLKKCEACKDAERLSYEEQEEERKRRERGY